MDICWFCLREIDKKDKNVEFSWEFDTYFHITCLEHACENADAEDPELPFFVNEMNEKGYEFSIGDD